MSYCRQPYYIYPNINGTVCFDVFGDIPDDVVNVFLYKLYSYRKEDFDKRIKDGKTELEEWEQSKDKPQSFEDMYDEPTERYCTVAESLEQSLKEMQLIRQGKLPKKTWREYRNETDEEYNRFINDNIEDIVELETNTECDTFEEQWFEDVKQYTEKVNNGLISSQESLNSLIKAGICNNDGELTEPYKVVDKETARKAMEDCTKKYNNALKNLTDE